MRKYILLAASLALATTAGSAMASTKGFYYSGLAGASLMPSLGWKDSAGRSSASFDTGYALGGNVGYDTGQGWRFELDSIYQLSPVDQFSGSSSAGHLRSTSVMANTELDLTQDTQFTPYVGVGVGYQDVGGTVNGLSGDSWEPAYQAEAGLRYDLSRDLSLFGEYRFSQSEAARLSDPTDMANQHFSDHLLLTGITIHLGQD